MSSDLLETTHSFPTYLNSNAASVRPVGNSRVRPKCRVGVIQSWRIQSQFQIRKWSKKKVPLIPLTASEKQVRLITDTGEKNNCWWLWLSSKLSSKLYNECICPRSSSWLTVLRDLRRWFLPLSFLQLLLSHPLVQEITVPTNLFDYARSSLLTRRLTHHYSLIGNVNWVWSLVWTLRSGANCIRIQELCINTWRTRSLDPRKEIVLDWIYQLREGFHTSMDIGFDHTDTLW